MTAAPSSCASTCCGLSALPTSLASTSCDDVDHPGFGIDFDLRRGAHELPELRPSAERMLGIDTAAALFADADDLAARRAESRLHHLGVDISSVRGAHFAGAHVDRRRPHGEGPRRHLSELSP